MGPSCTTFLEELPWTLLTSANAFLLTFLLAEKGRYKTVKIVLKA